MTSPLHVLLVCVNDDDAEPWLQALRGDGFEVSSRRAGNVEDFRAALAHPCDVILADAEGPFSAAQALREMAAMPCTLPLIVLGGREEAFASLMQAGARDVVGSYAVHRLSGIVRRELPRTRIGSGSPGTLRTETKLHRAHAALLQLARARTFQGDNLIEDLRHISEVAAHALDVARASVWLYDATLTKIRCVDLYEMEFHRHTDGMELLFSAHPSYFLSLEEQRLIVAHDAHRDPRTCEYSVAYLGPNGIVSMLDAAARLRGQLVGVICLEHVGSPRRWTTEEEVFACALADLVSLALESAERQSAETALAASERRFREIFENTRDAVVLIGVRGGERFVCEAINPAAEAASGYRDADVRDKTIEDVLPAELADILVSRYRQCLHSGASISYEHELPLPAGPRWFSTLLVPIRHPDGSIYRIAAIARDVTERIQAEQERGRLQAQLHQARKLEALGTLAGGVAHDFNNFLTGILGNAELLQQDLSMSPEARERLAQIVEISLRARDLVRQILAFSRGSASARKPVTLGPVVRAAMKYLRVMIPSGVRVEVDLPAREPQILGDVTQMHQVILNLCTNAVQALGGRGGTMTISLAEVDVDPEFARKHANLKPGGYARLAVRDTGCGMTAETLEHLFEPFFTTQPAGQGTGLGLAVVHGIVAQHEGAIVVTSQPGQGATFQVYLPLLPPVQPTMPTASPSLMLGTGQRVLFVDDQPFMADYGMTLLRRLGYRPEVFTDPERGLAAFRADPGSYDVIITDYSMPQMTGFDLAQQIRAVRKDVPILLLTGFEGVLDPTRAALAGIREIVPKPFTLEALAELLQRVLTRR